MMGPTMDLPAPAAANGVGRAQGGGPEGTPLPDLEEESCQLHLFTGLSSFLVLNSCGAFDDQRERERDSERVLWDNDWISSFQ